METKHLLVYTTYPNITQGEAAATEAIEKKYAASADIIPAMISFYPWKGKVKKETEVTILLKTTKDKYHLLENLLKYSHPYESPCIIAMEINEGEKNYLNWITENIKD